MRSTPPAALVISLALLTAPPESSQYQAGLVDLNARDEALLAEVDPPKKRHDHHT